VRDERGAILRWYGTCTDIQDLKATEAALAEALEMKEALLYEVNHRVKNNLQVITGLLTMQASRSTNPETRRDLADARARIGVVAAIHQSLYTTAAHSEVEMRGFHPDLAEEPFDPCARRGIVSCGWTGGGTRCGLAPGPDPSPWWEQLPDQRRSKYGLPTTAPASSPSPSSVNAQGLRRARQPTRRRLPPRGPRGPRLRH
jgi:hypothetical protein